MFKVPVKKKVALKIVVKKIVTYKSASNVFALPGTRDISPNTTCRSMMDRSHNVNSMAPKRFLSFPQKRGRF